MNRPTLEVADIFRAHGDSFAEHHRKTVRFQQLKVMRAITQCRTAALGGHIDRCRDASCPRCGDGLSFNSCRNRACPKCQGQARQRWIAARQQELLATSYFHVVFTLPHELHALIWQNTAELFNLLFRAAADTLLEVAANPEHLGAEIGFFAILHTWGQNLLFHPHIHCVVPAGGLAPDRTRWIRGSPTFFLPMAILRKVFRGKFVDGLKTAFRSQRLTMEGPLQHLTSPKCFAAFIHKLHQHDWVVYPKSSFGNPERVLRYLGRYTHRIAISNHRLIAFDGNRVTFRWRDYAHGNKKRKMTITAEEFIRRFLVHVLPKAFVRIRHFGFMANYQRTASLDLCRKLLDMPPLDHSNPPASARSLRSCPRCGGPMVIVERLTATQLRWRFSAPCVLDTS